MPKNQYLSNLEQEALAGDRKAIRELAEFAQIRDSQATSDTLTDLLNERGTYEQLERILKEAKRKQISNQEHRVAIFYIDLNGLKHVNDVYGHQKGNILIETFIIPLLETFRRPSDIVGRLGGDEFLTVCPETNEQGASVLEQRLERKLSQYTLFFNKDEDPKREPDKIPISAAVGSYVVTDPEKPIPDILRVAEQRMYQHKRRQKQDPSLAHLIRA